VLDLSTGKLIERRLVTLWWIEGDCGVRIIRFAADHSQFLYSNKTSPQSTLSIAQEHNSSKTESDASSAISHSTNDLILYFF